MLPHLPQCPLARGNGFFRNTLLLLASISAVCVLADIWLYFLKDYAVWIRIVSAFVLLFAGIPVASLYAHSFNRTTLRFGCVREWLRWVFFVPLALVLGLVLSLPIWLVFSHLPLWRLLSAILHALGTCCLLHELAPRNRRLVLGIFALILLANAAHSFVHPYPPRPMDFAEMEQFHSFALQALTACACFAIAMFLDKKKPPQDIPQGPNGKE